MSGNFDNGIVIIENTLNTIFPNATALDAEINKLKVEFDACNLEEKKKLLRAAIKIGLNIDYDAVVNGKPGLSNIRTFRPSHPFESTARAYKMKLDAAIGLLFVADVNVITVDDDSVAFNTPLVTTGGRTEEQELWYHLEELIKGRNTLTSVTAVTPLTGTPAAPVLVMKFGKRAAGGGGGGTPDLSTRAWKKGATKGSLELTLTPPAPFEATRRKPINRAAVINAIQNGTTGVFDTIHIPDTSKTTTYRGLLATTKQDDKNRIHANMQIAADPAAGTFMVWESNITRSNTNWTYKGKVIDDAYTVQCKTAPFATQKYYDTNTPLDPAGLAMQGVGDAIAAGRAALFGSDTHHSFCELFFCDPNVGGTDPSYSGRMIDSRNEIIKTIPILINAGMYLLKGNVFAYFPAAHEQIIREYIAGTGTFPTGLGPTDDPNYAAKKADLQFILNIYDLVKSEEHAKIKQALGLISQRIRDMGNQNTDPNAQDAFKQFADKRDNTLRTIP